MFIECTEMVVSEEDTQLLLTYSSIKLTKTMVCELTSSSVQKTFTYQC